MLKIYYFNLLLLLCAVMNADNKIAFIIGVTGQDGAYLSRFLIDKGYLVHGMKRRSSSINTERLDDIYEEAGHRGNDRRRFILHYGDVTDTSNVIRLIQEMQPAEIYNL